MAWNLVGTSLVNKSVLASLETAMSECSPAAHSLSDGATIQKQSPRLPMTFRLQAPRRQRRANTREDEWYRQRNQKVVDLASERRDFQAK